MLGMLLSDCDDSAALLYLWMSRWAGKDGCAMWSLRVIAYIEPPLAGSCTSYMLEDKLVPEFGGS